jgi:hypothetical protein
MICLKSKQAGFASASTGELDFVSVATRRIGLAG